MKKERPILFSGPMVRALLAGTKTQTRRTCKVFPTGGHIGRLIDETWEWCRDGGFDQGVIQTRCPYGQPGDQLRVRETWKPDPAWGYPRDTKPSHIDPTTNILYRATLAPAHPKYSFHRWRPSIFMPRWASRLTLEIESVRVERLQEISVEDALAEGITHRTMNCPKVEYQWLWESINGPGSWAKNYFVWVLNFKRV